MDLCRTFLRFLKLLGWKSLLPMKFWYAMMNLFSYYAYY